MKVLNIDVSNLKLLETTESKEIYDLENGYILKKYINVNERILNIYRKKLILAKDISIKNLISPEFLYEENGKINGSIEKKITGTSYANYLRAKRKRNEQITLEDVGSFYIKKHDIIMDANKEDINFPDGSYNNFFIDENENIYAIDYDGMQIKGITSREFNEFVFNGNNRFLFRNEKYIDEGLINYNMDIYMMGIEFLFLTTKLDPISYRLKNIDDFKDFLDYVNFPNTELRKKLELLYNSNEDNRYFKDELEDFIKKYTLTTDRKGVPRIFIKK
ncbi:MAG TPA: hypothetical protein IAB59_04580 [Candidatus Onthousia faecipullorum]|uniref:Uncharacterized protein n=1 Tax=Candidatus Onthousia faecipullorum TaxID=2840887 RepID=A0A9D1GAR8_9FIRM|nr:hypothetical protein [Candidatus Onthousia faecipullorum]